MAASTGDLSVRSHERVKCALAAEVWIAERNQDQVRLSGRAANTEGAVRATMVDCSLGGLGLLLPVFFPRSCRLKVRIEVPASGQGAPSTIEVSIAAQRVAMMDRTPTYYLGGSFDEASGETVRRLVDLVRRVARGEEPARA